MNHNRFTISYSPEHKDEILKIKEKYITAPTEKSDIEKLKELDRKAEIPGQVVSLILGITGLLMLGGGMSLILENITFLAGIILGVAGIIVMIPAYPVYKSLTKKNRKKIAAQVLELVDKISNSPSK
ncbi:MAG: hypothetical protein IJ491_01530 [Clostridia bacterium]|nr:hypothetical protein [Clostridia bacterium]